MNPKFVTVQYHIHFVCFFDFSCILYNIAKIHCNVKFQLLNAIHAYKNNYRHIYSKISVIPITNCEHLPHANLKFDLAAPQNNIDLH